MVDGDHDEHGKDGGDDGDSGDGGDGGDESRSGDLGAGPIPVGFQDHQW